MAMIATADIVAERYKISREYPPPAPIKA